MPSWGLSAPPPPAPPPPPTAPVRGLPNALVIVVPRCRMPRGRFFGVAPPPPPLPLTVVFGVPGVRGLDPLREPARRGLAPPDVCACGDAEPEVTTRMALTGPALPPAPPGPLPRPVPEMLREGVCPAWPCPPLARDEAPTTGPGGGELACAPPVVLLLSRSTAVASVSPPPPDAALAEREGDSTETALLLNAFLWCCAPPPVAPSP